MHYTVMVISNPKQSVDEQLAPFNENMEVEPYINKTKQAIIDEVHASDAKTVAEIEKSLAKDEPDEVYMYFFGEWEKNGRRIPTQDDLEYAKKLAGRSDEEAYNAYIRTYDDMDYDEDGNELSTYNPNSQWDWYSVGGRWDGGIPMKGGNATNQCLVGEVDCSVDKDSEDYKSSVRFWEVVVGGAEQTDEEKQDKGRFFTLYGPQYYKDYYKDADDYAERCCRFSTYAVLDSEGTWHEPGKVGWFSSSDTPESKNDWDENFVKRFIEDQPDDYIVTLVDCHI